MLILHSAFYFVRPFHPLSKFSLFFSIKI